MLSNIRKSSVLLLIAAFFLIASFLIATTASGSESAYSFGVEVRGQGTPLILIPGLSCGSDVWESVAAVLEAEYELHLIHLPGFAGRPAVEPPFLPRIEREIIAYVQDQGLERPVVMGHSLGGFLAFALASAEPELFGPVVAVDGVPFLPALGNADADEDSTRASAEGMRAMMASLSAEQFAMQNRMVLTSMITDAENVDLIAESSQQSDPATVGQAVYEMMLTDLRDEVAAITSPVLLIAAGSHASSDEARAALRRAYESQVESAADHRVVVAGGARHFIMLDDLSFLLGEVQRFLDDKIVAPAPAGVATAQGERLWAL